MTDNSFWAVVPAAGTGSRMLADRPKQYLLLDGRPVLLHTLERLLSHPRISGVVVAIASDDSYWPQLTIPQHWPLLVAEGGAERADSVLNALSTLQQHTHSDPWVLVHDAARPCLRHEDIDQLLEQLVTDAVGGILAVPMTDTVKRADAQGRIAETVCRQSLWRAATPQMFRLRALRQALQTAAAQGLKVTDEASAMEYTGQQPRLVQGHADNIKITLPQDLALATLYLQQQAGEAQ